MFARVSVRCQSFHFIEGGPPTEREIRTGSYVNEKNERAGTESGNFQDSISCFSFTTVKYS